MIIFRLLNLPSRVSTRPYVRCPCRMHYLVPGLLVAFKSLSLPFDGYQQHPTRERQYRKRHGHTQNIYGTRVIYHWQRNCFFNMWCCLTKMKHWYHALLLPKQRNASYCWLFVRRIYRWQVFSFNKNANNVRRVFKSWCQEVDMKKTQWNGMYKAGAALNSRRIFTHKYLKFVLYETTLTTRKSKSRNNNLTSFNIT